MEHNESYSGSARVRTTEDYLEDHPRETGPANTFGNAAQDVGKDAQKRGREVFGKVADEAQSVALRFRGEATGALGEGKTQLAAQIGGVARALKASSREFRHDNLVGLADLSEELAEQVEAAQHYLDERSGESLLADIRTFASRNRTLFVGSLFVAGLVTARFAQSAPGSSTSSSGTQPQPATTTVVSRERNRQSRVKTYRTDR